MKTPCPITKAGLTLIYTMAVSLATAQPGWEVNPSAYQYTMTITGVGLYQCDTTTNPANHVAAFVNGECRGYAAFDTEVNGMALAYLTVYDNEAQGSDVSFKLYNADNSEVYDSPVSILFAEGAIIGNAAQPYRFRTDFTIDALIMPDDSLFDYFLAGQPVSELYLLNENGEILNGSFDFVNDELGHDNSKFEIIGSLLIIQEDVSYGVQNSYQIHITGTTDSGCTFNQVFILQVINTNVPPRGLKINRFTVFENEPEGTLVGLLEADDESPDDSHTFIFDPSQPSSDTYAFEIAGKELLTRLVLDYEKQVLYTLPVLIQDASGNKVVDTLYVEVLDVIEFDDLKASNLLTPNNDGHNDTFYIPNIALYTNYELIVFNAQGSRIYTTRNYDNTWEGTASNGSLLPTGTYYYVFTDTQNSTNSFRGEIHIYRNNKF